MLHIGFRYTYCVLCADVLSSVFITCDFGVLTFEFHVLSFPFCVLCCMYEDCDFLFRRRDKEIHSKCADAEMEKERVQKDKNGKMNNCAILAVSSSSPYGYLCPKIKTQKSKHRSHQFRTQTICIQNTMSHTGFRNIRNICKQNTMSHIGLCTF